MIDWLVSTLQDNPQLAIFLALAIGYWIGAMRFGSFSLGAVTGTLIAGVLIGQLMIEISPQVKSIFFIIFLFAVGYGVGPQFVRGVASDGAPQALFAAVLHRRNRRGLRPRLRCRAERRRADHLGIDRARDRRDQPARPDA